MPNKGIPMPNAPKAAARKRNPPTKRQNSQDDHEGSPHAPDEFDAVNPAKQVGPGSATRTRAESAAERDEIADPGPKGDLPPRS